MSEDSRIVVALVGGQPLIRAGLRALLQQAPDIEVGVEVPGAEVLAALPTARSCDLALFDDEGRIAPRTVVGDVRTLWHEVPVLALVPTCSYPVASEWIRAGAQGVIGRDQTLEQLVHAVRKVSQGELWIDRLTSARLIRELTAERKGTHVPAPIGKVGRLSAREREVVVLVARGMSNKMIANALGISDNTVRRHLSSIFAKLEVPDRLALALSAHGDPRFASLQ